jgi:hypothetical protein
LSWGIGQAGRQRLDIDGDLPARDPRRRPARLTGAWQAGPAPDLSGLLCHAGRTIVLAVSVFLNVAGFTVILRVIPFLVARSPYWMAMIIVAAGFVALKLMASPVRRAD